MKAPHSRSLLVLVMLIACLVTALPLASAQQEKRAPAQKELTGRYEGTASNGNSDVITVALELTEKDGALSGVIHSSHGDFTISGGSHKGDEATLEFQTGGPTGTMTLKIDGEKLAGAWSAGDEAGPIEVKKAAAQEEAPKGKS